jgi:hypothetical protein
MDGICMGDAGGAPVQTFTRGAPGAETPSIPAVGPAAKRISRSAGVIGLEPTNGVGGARIRAIRPALMARLRLPAVDRLRLVVAALSGGLSLKENSASAGELRGDAGM